MSKIWTQFKKIIDPIKYYANNIEFSLYLNKNKTRNNSFYSSSYFTKHCRNQQIIQTLFQ